MLYPEQVFESKLNFHTIREWLDQDCITIMGKEKIKSITFSNSESQIKIWQEQNEIFRHLIESDSIYPKIFFEDIRPSLRKARVGNSFLDPEELLHIRQTAKLSDQWLEFFEDDHSGVYKIFQNGSPEIRSKESVIAMIDDVIDSKGDVRDDASPALRELRMDIAAIESKVRRAMQSTYKDVLEKGYLADQTEITIRNGRLVIPMAVENKRAIKGYIHAHSGTGQTAYVEPAEVFEMNNELEDLFTEERKEVIRILMQLSDDLRPYLPEMEASIEFLSNMDVIRAKAKLAVKIKAGFPAIKKRNTLKLVDARHPLLFVLHESLKKQVVPLSVEIDNDNRILLISGPNAGGKSVALKTVGLMVYMFQCGLPVSVSDQSEFGIFDDIFIDIGDEQSIENDLSTYSSHLKNMKEMLSNAGKNSLILLDEFGTGTDPQFGGAIAEVILEELNSHSCKGIINTHYSNLKAFANKTDGLFNGAMLFDIEHMEPLYKLQIGKPGSSFAFEVAEKIGLPQQLLEKAKEKVGYSQIEYDKMLMQLETEKKELEDLNKKLTHKDANLDKVAGQYRAMKEKLQKERKEMIEQAKREAAGIVKGANKRIEKTIREIRELQADKSKTKELRESLNKYLENTEESLEKYQEKEEEIIEETPTIIDPVIGIGDIVESKDSGARGEVIGIKGKEAEIAIGDIRSFVKLKKLVKLSGPQKKKEGKGSFRTLHDLSLLEFSPYIDLRGKRAADVIAELDKFIDKALLAGVRELSILHGKGDGILRKVIRDHLKSFKEISHIESEHADRGGDGITLVRMS